MFSSMRNFFLSLFISLVIFGISAYFLVGFVKNSMFTVLDSPETTEQEEEENKPEGPKEQDIGDDGPTRMTVLICGMDDGLSQLDESLETDSIVLLQIDKNKKEFMFTALPCDTKIDLNGYRMRLGMVYSEFSIEHLLSCVKTLTGLNVNYYALVNYESLQNFFDLIGDVEFNVPTDMYYMPSWKQDLFDKEIHKRLKEPDYPDLLEDEERDPEIDLKMGVQQIDGEKALQLLRYKGYSNGDIGRMTTLRDFIKEIFRQKVTLENYSKSLDIFKALKESVTTNMTEDTFLKNIDLIFSYSKFAIVDKTFPGTPGNLENGTLFFNPLPSNAISLFKEYRDDVLER